MNDAVALPLNTSFSQIVPGLQIAVDSTSIGAGKSCARYYHLSIGTADEPGYATRAENVHFVFGIEYHKALELYDRKRAEGKSHDEATCAAVRQALVNTWRFDLGRPWPSDDPRKNRETLIRTIVWYLEQFVDDPLETIILKNGKPAVEQSFRFESEIVSSLSGEHYKLCGHIDRLVRWQGRIWIVDRKTTKFALDENYFLRFTPDNQVSLYSLAGTVIAEEEVAGFIIDAAQIGATFSRFRRAQVTRTSTQLAEWLLDLQIHLRVMEGHARAGYWPQNDKACNSYMSDANPYGCSMRPICGMSPELRAKHLDALYTRRVWDPLQTREV